MSHINNYQLLFDLFKTADVSTKDLLELEKLNV